MSSHPTNSSTFVAMCFTVAAFMPAMATADDLDSATQVYQLFKDKCFRCHGSELNEFNILNREELIADRGENLVRYLEPGKPEASLIWKRIAGGEMPPDPTPKLTDEEQTLVQRWISEGAKLPVEPARQHITELDVLDQIKQHLFGLVKEDREFQRYFTITHLHNIQSVTREELRMYRAALSKAVNSMSRKSRIQVPQPIDDAKTIFNIDLRHYGWEDRVRVWNNVLKEYPYGVQPLASQAELRRAYDEIDNLMGGLGAFDKVTHIRADWFITKATRPPLYHVLTGIPSTLDDLLKEMNVSVKDDFFSGQAKRAGLFQSGVSGQNRLVEYHDSVRGAFWISYDFERNGRRSNLARFPLGPKFEGVAVGGFDNIAFDHAGGEVIFALPNRLHGYMLVNGENARIDAAPVDIVWDGLNSAGTPQVVNGISCMSCHKHGLRELTDFVRDGVAVRDPNAIAKVRQLYAPNAVMDRLVTDAKGDYMRQLRTVLGEFLEGNEHLEDFPEPISVVARLYDKNLDLETAARELGFEDTNTLTATIDNNNDLIGFGLKPLTLPGGTIKRTFWDSIEDQGSVFQQAAQELSRGIPVRRIR